VIISTTNVHLSRVVNYPEDRRREEKGERREREGEEGEEGEEGSKKESTPLIYSFYLPTFPTRTRNSR